MKNALKNSIKKIAAIGGSAVMLGATMLGAVAAADFSTITDKAGASDFYTTNGELNAMVMLGTLGTDVLGVVSDLAGAIDVAAAFAQKATLGGEGGGALVAKNVTPGYLNSVGLTEAVAYGRSVVAKTFSSATTGFDWLRNETVGYNDTGYFMEDMISVSALGTLQFTGVFYWQGPGGVAYNITANRTMPLNFDQFKIKDQTYQIVAFNNATGTETLELGQLQREEGINVGGFVDVGTTGIKLKLTGIKQTFTAWKAVFDIYDTSISETTPVVTGVEKAPLDPAYSNDTLGIKFTVYTMYKDASDIWNVDIDWTEASVVLKHNNMTTSIFPGYYVDIGFDRDTYPFGINWVNFRSPGGWTQDTYWPSTSFSAGDSVEVMTASDGWFKVAYEMDRIGADTTIDEGSENAVSIAQSIDAGITGSSSFEVTFKNNETTDSGIDLSNYMELSNPGGITFPSTVGPIKPTLTKTYYASWYNDGGSDAVFFQEAVGSSLYGANNVTCDGSTWTNTSLAGQWWYNVTCDSNQINLTFYRFVSNASYLWNNLTFIQSGISGDSTKSKLMLKEPTGESIYIEYNTSYWNLDDYGSAIGTAPLVYDRTAATDITFSGTSTSQYTQYGTLISPSTNNFVLVYPQYQRVAKIYVGRTAETTETVNVGEQISSTGWFLKSGGGESPVWIFSGPTANGIAALDSESVARPVILIGGPGANAKVKTLYDAGDVLQMNGTALTPEADTAYVELVENAFGNHDALIIAGTGADDTRMACKVIASQILYGTPLTNFEGTKLKMSTGVGTFTDVTAEAYT